MAAEPIDPALERELGAFVAAEAALLDAARYDEWLALYADDGRYWVPLQGARQAMRSEMVILLVRPQEWMPRRARASVLTAWKAVSNTRRQK